MLNTELPSYFDLFFSKSPEAILIIDNQLQIVYANTSFNIISGLKEYNPKDLNELLLHCSEADRVTGLIQQAFKGDSVFSQPIQCFAEDEFNKDWFKVEAYPITSEDKDSGYVILVLNNVTDQVNQKPELDVQRDMYKALYNASHVPYQSLSDDGLIRDVNPAWLETLGYSEVEVIGMSFGDLLHDEDLPVFLENFKKLRKVGSVSGTSYRIRHKDGSYRHIMVKGKIGINRNTNTKQTYCVFQDITSRIKVEKELEIEQRRIRTLMSNVPGIVFRCKVDEHWTMECLSDGCYSLTGYKPNEFIGNNALTFDSIIHEDDRESVRDAILEATKEMSHYEVEYRVITKSGVVKWVWERGISIEEIDGENILEGFITDITERILYRKQLEKNEVLLSAILDTVPDYVWVKNEDGQYVSCNKKLRDLFQKGNEEIIGKSDIDIVSKEQAELFRSYDKLVLEKMKPITYEQTIKNTVTGNDIELETHKAPLYDDTGQLIGILGVGRDITEKKNITNRLLDKERQIQAIYDDKTTFIGVLDSEFRLIECNNSALNFINCSLDDVQNLPFPDLPWWRGSEPCRQKLIESLKRAKEGKSVIFRAKNFGANDEVKYVNLSVRPISNSQGEICSFLVEGQDVTETFRIREELQASEEKFKRLSENAKDMIFRMSLPEGKYEYVNSSAKTVMGISAEEFYAHPLIIKEILHSDWLDIFKKGWEDITNGSVKPVMEYQIVTPEGETKWIHQRSVIVKNNDGVPIALEGIATDLTELKHVQEELEKNQIRYIKAQALGKVGNWEYDIKTDEYWGSAESKKIYGFSEDKIKLTSEEVEGCIPDRERVHQALVDLLEHNKHYDIEFEINTFDKGIKKMIHSTAFIEYDKNGEPLKVTGLIQDVSERVENNNKLMNLNQRLKLATESADLGIWELDLVAGTLIWDNKMFQIYEIDPDLFSYHYSSWVDVIFEEDREKVSEEFRSSLNSGKYKCEYRITTPTGQVKVIESYATFLYSQCGKPVRMYGINRDITKNKTRDEELENYKNHLELLVNERTQELEEANQELESFSYSVSHDLRAPLRAISGFCNILEEDYSDGLDEEGKRLLSIITNNALTMNQLITDILRLSRITRKEINKVYTDMNVVVNSCFCSVANEQEKKDFEFVVHNLDMAPCDPNSMKLVWSNLIGNALKYSSKSEKKKIEVTSYLESDRIIYQIQDWGAGFNEEYSEKLFGVFQRLHKPDEFSGTGIGLALCKRIINKHDGNISAKGKIGYGATFRFYLPLE